MPNEYSLLRATLSTLTPLHIGSGQELLQDYDYAVHAGRTWRIDEDALLEAQGVADPAIADTLARTPPAQLLGEDDFKPGSPFFRYILSGTPRSQQPGAQVREQLKDVWQQPYVPGSSLKGALRTALAWYGLRSAPSLLNARMLNRNAKWAAQRIEGEVLGRDPNHDLLRALHVADSVPVDAERLMLVNAQVVTRGGTGSPIEVEAVRPDTVFELTIKLDEALFSDWAAELGLGERADWLRHLPAVVQAHTQARLEHELEWYQNRPGGEAARDFYRQLAGLRLPPTTCLLQLGWGGGWDSKTVGDLLRRDEAFLEGIIRDYRLARGRRQAGDPFPKSRRVAMRLERSRDGRTREAISLPLGWLVLEIEAAS